tara:strand:+ start:277 stop:495 length:219 start_codon:yes stop_codon:yes gene_type:complete
MKFKPTHEHMDGRGMSVRYAEMRDNRRAARRKAEQIMGKSYFTNPNESLELDHGHKHDYRRPGVTDFQTHGS